MSIPSLTHLILSENLLSGGIPREFAVHSQLVVLDLSYNQLTFEIPYEIERLRDLQELRLNHNRLVNEIPPGIGKMRRLEVIALHQNQLTGQIPDELSNLGRLRMLLLDGNRLSGAIPPQLEELGRLQWFAIIDNDFSGCIPRVLQDVGQNDFEFANITLCGDASRTEPATPAYIRLDFGETITPSQRLATKLGIRWTTEFIEKIGWRTPERTITAYVDDDEGLERALRGRLGDCEFECAESINPLASDSTALPDATFNPTFVGYHVYPHVQARIASIELTHAIQLGLLEDYAQEGTQHGPLWWLVGLPSLFQRLAFADARGAPTDEARHRFYPHPDDEYSPLSALEEAEGDCLLTCPCMERCAIAAIDFLASQVGLRSLADYYTERLPGATWQQTFKHVFNISVPEFYLRFEEHRKNGFPPRDLPIVGSTDWPSTDYAGE